MVATQSFSIQRRALDVEDYIDIGRRHVGWIAGPAFAGAVVSIVVAFMLPNVYTSHATMRITPSQISENLVQSTLSTTLGDRVQQMRQNIESRASLSSIINDPKLQLYRDDLLTKPLEDVIDDMKKDIVINMVTLPGEMGKHASAFDIYFSYPDRVKAQQTVAQLINKFDEESVSAQKTQQDSVRLFVNSQLQKAKADLGDANDALTKFRQDHAGQLPESVQLNISQQTAVTAKITAVGDQIYRTQQAIDQLDTTKSIAQGRLDSLNEAEAQAETLALPGTPQAAQNADLLQLDKEIDREQSQLELARRQWTDKHPTVKALVAQLEQSKTNRTRLETKLAKEKADADATRPKDAPKKPADPRIAESRRTIEGEILQIANRRKQFESDLVRLNQEQDTYKKQSQEISDLLKASIGIEAPYEDLRRAQGMAEQHYANLEKDQHITDANSQLIEQKAGENLDVLDSPTMPMTPTKPSRPLIIGAGFGLSLVIGLAVAALQEAKDTSLKNLKDVRAYTNLPVLCSIPLLENTMLVKRKRRLTYLAWSAGVLVGAAAITGAVTYYMTITRKG